MKEKAWAVTVRNKRVMWLEFRFWLVELKEKRP